MPRVDKATERDYLVEARCMNNGKMPKHVILAKFKHLRKREVFIFNDDTECVDFCIRLGNNYHRVLR